MISTYCDNHKLLSRNDLHDNQGMEYLDDGRTRATDFARRERSRVVRHLLVNQHIVAAEAKLSNRADLGVRELVRRLHHGHGVVDAVGQRFCLVLSTS